MTRLHFSVPARRDMRGILEYIGRDSRRNAERFLARIEAACQALADAPDLGNQFPSLPDIKFWTVQKYVIVFQCGEAGIEILRVVHGAQNWFAEFEGK